MKANLILALVLILSGCATQVTTLEEHKPDGSFKTSKSRTTTFFDSKSELSKLKTSNAEKTQSIGIDGINQESTGTNVINIVEAVVGAAVKAAVAKP